MGWNLGEYDLGTTSQQPIALFRQRYGLTNTDCAPRIVWLQVLDGGNSVGGSSTIG